jgi:hypothetical protein
MIGASPKYGKPWIKRGSTLSPLLLEHCASFAVLLETQFAFGEAALEYVDPGLPTAARPGSTAASGQEHDADDEQEPEQWKQRKQEPSADKSH